MTQRIWTHTDPALAHGPANTCARPRRSCARHRWDGYQAQFRARSRKYDVRQVRRASGAGAQDGAGRGCRECGTQQWTGEGRRGRVERYVGTDHRFEQACMNEIMCGCVPMC